MRSCHEFLAASRSQGICGGFHGDGYPTVCCINRFEEGSRDNSELLTSYYEVDSQKVQSFRVKLHPFYSMCTFFVQEILKLSSFLYFGPLYNSYSMVK